MYTQRFKTKTRSEHDLSCAIERRLRQLQKQGLVWRFCWPESELGFFSETLAFRGERIVSEKSPWEFDFDFSCNSQSCIHVFGAFFLASDKKGFVPKQTPWKVRREPNMKPLSAFDQNRRRDFLLDHVFSFLFAKQEASQGIDFCMGHWTKGRCLLVCCPLAQVVPGKVMHPGCPIALIHVWHMFHIQGQSSHMKQLQRPSSFHHMSPKLQAVRPAEFQRQETKVLHNICPSLCCRWKQWRSRWAAQVTTATKCMSFDISSPTVQRSGRGVQTAMYYVQH